MDGAEAGSDNGDGGDELMEMDEMKAHAVAEELVRGHSAKRNSSQKQIRARLLDWMLQNERNEIDVVGAGTAEVRQGKKTIKASDLMFMSLRDEPYNWTEEQIEGLVETMAANKEHLIETKSVLKIRLARQSKKKKRKRTTTDEAPPSPLFAPLEASPPPAPTTTEENNDAKSVEKDDQVAPKKKSKKNKIRHAESKDHHEGSKDHLADDEPSTLSADALKTTADGSGRKLPDASQEMDVRDITAGRSRPHFPLTDTLGPIRPPMTPPSASAHDVPLSTKQDVPLSTK